jgi:hypothetical protein
VASNQLVDSLSSVGSLESTRWTFVMENAMLSWRSLLSYIPAALTGGPLAVDRATARSAAPELVGIDGWLPEGRVRVRFSAAKPHLVAGSPQPAPVRISVDGVGDRAIEVGTPTLYTLFDSDDYGEHLLELQSAAPGLSLFSATFG